jgi:hypothetical protein
MRCWQCRRRPPRNPTVIGNQKSKKAGDGSSPAFASLTPDHGPLTPDQCTLTISSSWLQAFATAASRLSVSMMGVPSAA